LVLHVLSECSSVISPNLPNSQKTGVDKEHVHPARLNLHGFANAINVGKIRDIALYGGDVAFDRRDRVIELRLAAAVMKTRAPSSAKRLAAPKPMPALPPVTTATLFSSFPFTNPFICDNHRGPNRL
jgi:hypothetical protein